MKPLPEEFIAQANDMCSELGVPKERSHWRDMLFSVRHRLWGVELPMVDVDFLCIEAYRRTPIALFEYKKGHPDWDYYSQGVQFSLLMRVAAGMNLAFFTTVYNKDFSSFDVTPCNHKAEDMIKGDINELTKSWKASELQYVSWLYQIRVLIPPKDLPSRIERIRFIFKDVI